MKKLFLLFAIAISALTVNAQKSQMAVGVDFGIAPCIEKGASLSNFGIGAKFQYGLTDAIRLEADAEYWLKDKQISIFDASINAHYLINVTEKFKVYPLVGIGYANVKGYAEICYDDDDDDEYGYGYYSRYDHYYDDDEDDDVVSSGSISRLIANVGLGAEYSLSNNLCLFVEAKYQYMKNLSRIPIQIGVAYKF